MGMDIIALIYKPSYVKSTTNDRSERAFLLYDKVPSYHHNEWLYGNTEPVFNVILKYEFAVFKKVYIRTEHYINTEVYEKTMWDTFEFIHTPQSLSAILSFAKQIKPEYLKITNINVLLNNRLNIYILMQKFKLPQEIGMKIFLLL